MFEKCLYFNANAVVRQLNRIWDQAYAETGLSAPHAYLLRMVCHHEGVTQQQVADELHLEKSTVTRFVHALIEKNLIARHSGQDGRENRLVATAAGKRLGRRLDEIGSRLYRQMNQQLGKEEFAELVAQLRTTLQVV